MITMFDDLANTFYLNVVATYDDYVVHRDADTAGLDKHLRAAVTTAIAMYHFREHLPHKMRPSAKAIIEQCPEYALIQGVSNASKHGTVTRGTPLVVSAADIREIAVITRYRDEEGEYSDSRTKVVVHCSDGRVQNLDRALTGVLNHFGNVLCDNSICEFRDRSKAPFPGAEHLTRENVSRLNLEIIRGLAWRHAMELWEWDDEIGQSTPMDVTGAEMTFRIYKPREQTAVFTLSHPEHGEISAEIPLTDSENFAFAQISTEREREEFMRKVLDAHREEVVSRLKDEAVALGQTVKVDKLL